MTRQVLAAFCAALAVALVSLPSVQAQNEIDRIGFTQNQITVLEGESVDLSIQIETSDGQPLQADAVVTLRISDNVGSGNTPIDLSRLVGDVILNAQNDLVVTITVPMGQTSGSTIPFTGISIAENVALDGELMFLLFIEDFTFAQTSGEGIFGFTTVTVDDDDDDPMLSLTAASYTVAENDSSTMDICAEISNVLSPTGTVETITVDVIVTAGTAIIGSGLDAALSSPSDGVLTFNTGSVSGQRQCTTFTIIDDDLLEGDENFQVSLDSPTGGANLDDPTSATVTITDNDMATVSLQAVSATVEGNDASVGVELAPPGSGTAISITVTLESIDGDATLGDDFAFAEGMSVTFPPLVLSTVQSLNISITDDMAIESDHSFTVAITSTSLAAVTAGNLSSATVTIIDDDEGEASVTFDSDQTSVSEDAGSTQICASLSLTSGFTLETMVIADFEVDPGDTEGDMDFSIDSVPPSSSVDGQFVFSAVGQVCQDVTIVNDSLLEFDEQFYVNLTDVFPPGVQLQPLNSTSVLINDDEERDGVLVFQQEAVYVNETDGMVDICVQVDSITGTVETPFQVDVTLANGIAVIDEDFDGPSMVTANFTSGSGLFSCIQVGIIDDDIFEGPHSFTADIEGSTVGMLNIGMPSRTTVRVLDPEDATVSFAVDAVSVSESAGNVTIQVTLDAMAIEVPIEITITGMSGTATIYDDFEPDISPVVIPANTAMRVFSYIVEIIDDDVVESNESFTLSLPDQASVDYTIGDNSTLSATIEDNDFAIVAMAAPSVFAVETEGVVPIDVKVTLSAGSEIDLVIPLFTKSGSMLNAATSDVDYDSNVDSVTLEATMSSGTITLTTNVTLIDDAVLEFEEEFTVFLDESESPSAVMVDSSANTTTVSLGDDESDNDVNVDESAVTVLESAGLTMVCASIDGVTEIERGFTGNFQIIADEDVTIPGEDFTFDGPLVFQFEAGPGNTACISINITDDVDFEGDRPFTVMLSEVAGSMIGPISKRTVFFSSPSGPLIGPNNQTVVTINDSEDVLIEFLNSTVYTEEGDTLDIYLLVDSDGTFLVNLTVQLEYISTELAALGEDFQILESYVVIPENFTRGIIDFSVDIVADDFVEGDHSFFVRLINNGSFTLGTNSELEVIILDDDICDIDVEIVTDPVGPPYLIEGISPSVTVCVLINNVTGPFQTSITIPLIIKELVPKSPYGYGGYYGGGGFGGKGGGGFGGKGGGGFGGKGGGGPFGRKRRDAEEERSRYARSSFYPYGGFKFGKLPGNPAIEDEDFSVEMDFGVFVFDNETVAGNAECANITILDDQIFEKFQVIVLTIGESDPPGIEQDEFLKIKIIDDEIADTVITVLNTSTIVMEEAKSTFDLCAELNVTEVQTKVAARFAVLLDRSLLENAGEGNFTCRNDSSIELPLAYLCEGVPPFYDDGSGYRRKRGVGSYGNFFIDCPDGSDESPDTCGDRRNFEFRPGNDIAKFEEAPVACATLDIYEDLDYEGDMEFSVLLVDVFPYDIFLRGNIRTDVIIRDTGDATVFLQDAELDVLEGTNVSVCGEIELAGELLTDINIEFFVIGGGPGADVEDIEQLEFMAVFSASDNVQSGDVACVTLSVVADDILEPPVDFLVRFDITPLVNEPQDAPDFTRVRVIDTTAQDVVLDFSMTSLSGAEGEAVEVCVNITSFPSGGVEIPVTLQLETIDGPKAVRGIDYEFEAGSSVTFQPSDFSLSPAPQPMCLNISLLSDSSLEGDHTFQVVIAAENSEPEITPGADSVAMVTISDQNNATVGYTALMFTGREGEGEVEVCLDITNLPTDGLECNVTVYLSAADGAKTVAGDDYVTPMVFNVVFPAFETKEGDRACAAITIIDDRELEGDEQDFFIHIGTIDPPNVLASVLYATVRIQDNDEDDATVGFAESAVNITEGELLEVCLELSNVPEGGVACDITATLAALPSLYGKQAMEGSDFTVLMNKVVFDVGSGNGTMRCVNFTAIASDMALEGFHHFIVVVNETSPQINVDEEAQYLSVYVIDNDTALAEPTINFHFTISENSFYRYVNACVEINSLPENGLECDTVLYLVAKSATAIEGEDFEAFSIPIYFESSSDSSPLVNCTHYEVPVIDDDIFEDTQSFYLILKSYIPQIAVDNSSPITVYIEDNDIVTVSFGMKEYIVEEGSSARVCLEFEEDVQRPFEVNITRQLLDDIIDGDNIYVLETYELAVGASFDNTLSEEETCNDIYASEDFYKEGLETFVLWLEANESYIFFGRDQALFLVPSNDVVYVSVVNTDFTVYEDEGALHLCLQVNHTVRTRAVVEISTSEGTASAGADYIELDTSLVFDEGLATTQCVYIPVLNDECLEYVSESFYIYLSSEQDCVRFSNDSYEAYIIDDDYVVISFEEAEYTVSESVGMTEVCVELCTGEPKRDFEFYVDVINSSATNPSDFYVASSTMLLYDVSDPPELLCVEINITDDIYLEMDEYFYLQLNTSDPDVWFKIDHSIVKIQDDDTAFLGLGQEYYQASEDDGSLQVCVTLFNHTERNVTASVYALPGSASEADYSGLPVYLTFTEAGPECFYVGITQDSLLEGTEYFYLVLATRDDDIIFDIRSAIVYIVDGNMLTIGFGQAGYSLVEDTWTGEGSTLEICLAVSGGTVDRTVVVSVADEDGTAIGGVDYDEFEFVTMTISLTLDGDGARRRRRSIPVQPYCFNVTFLPDDLVEFDETFELRLSTDDVDIALFPNTTTITILNNDYANVSLQFSEYEALEGSDPSVMVCTELTAGVLERGVTVELSTSDITAVAGSDYVTLTAPLTYEAGSPLNSRRCVNITIIDDDIIEPDQSFAVSLFTMDPVFLTPFDKAIVTIATDNDTANVTLQEPVYMVNESNPYVMVCAELTEGILERDITVYLSTLDGTAVAPGDYTSILNYPLTFSAGSPVGISKCAYINITDDLVVEPDQYFFVSLASTDPVYINPISLAQVIIADNDFATVSLSDSMYESYEDDGVVTVCAVLVDGELERVITVYLSTNDATAIAPGDYVPLVDVPLAFSIGAALNSSSCANITINDDLIVEYDEEFSVYLSTYDPVIIDPIEEANVTIIDNDLATASLQQAAYDASEAIGYVTVCVELTDGELERMITIYINTADGTAIGGSDYVSLMNIPVGFMSGDPVGSTACQNVSIIDDDVIEAEETFTVNASSSDPVIISPTAQAEVSITDNDVAVIALNPLVYEILEMESPLTVCTILVSGVLETTITATISTDDQTAFAPNDYLALSSEPVMYSPGDIPFTTMSCVNITIIDDDIVETNETFTILLSSSDASVEVSLMSNQATATIINDDRLSVSWQQSEYMVSESNIPLMVCAEIVAGSLERQVSVAVEAEDGTAVAGLDYDDNIADISFMSGQGVGDASCTNITILVDSLTEAEESFTIALLENSLVEVVQPNVSTVLIAEAEIGFSAPAYMVTEGQNLSVCLQLSGGLQESVDVSVMAVDAVPLSAQGGGVDYTFPNMVVTFNGSQTEMCVTLLTTDDSIYEFDETFDLQLSTSSMAVSLSTAMATVTINDDDIVNLAIFNSTTAVTEGEGDAELCIFIDAVIERPILVSLSAMSVTATLDEDFLAIPDETFTAGGPSVICAPISIIDDDIAENCVEMFGITVTSDGERVIDPTDMVVVQIIDDEEPEFCFIADTPMVDGANLTVLFDLQGCADVQCQTTTTTLVDCTPELGSTMGEYSVFNLPQRNSDPNGHILTITVTPTVHPSSEQVFTRAFRTDNSDRCSAVFINKGATVDFGLDVVTFEFTGTGPGILPENTVNEFTCIFNGINIPRDCSSPFMVPLDDPDLMFGMNEIGVRPQNIGDMCDQRRINRFNFDIIVDPVTVSFEIAEYTVLEGDGVQTICVELTSGTVERRVVVSVESSNAGAEAPGDYTEVGEDLTFTAANVIGSSVCFNVTIIDDAILEGDQSFTLSLSSVDPVMFGTDQANVTILDNDSVEASFALAAYEFPEDATDEAVCVLLSNSAERTVTVLLNTANETALASEDYLPLEDEVVTFLPGSTEECADLSIIDDAMVEPTETFLVLVSSMDIGVVISSPSQATVSILDNDQPVVTISQFEASVSEGAEMAEVCVSIDRAILSDVTFTLTPLNETAFAGEDFMPGGISGTFTSGGSTEMCFQITILNDTIAENCAETFLVTLSSNDADIGDQAMVQIQILDDDEPDFCFINDTPHVEGNTLELELQLLGCATILCTDPVEPFSEDCTPDLGSTTRAISFPGLTQVNSGGHTLVVTVTPNDAAFPVQTQERGYRVDNDERCTAVFINKGISVNTTAVVVEWEGTGPGVAPADTVNLFTCEINDNPPRSCESPYLIDLSDAELIPSAMNEIAVRVDPELDPICPRRPRQRMTFVLP